MQALTFGCRFGSRQNIDAHHDTEIDLRICENGLSKSPITRVTCICWRHYVSTHLKLCFQNLSTEDFWCKWQRTLKSFLTYVSPDGTSVRKKLLIKYIYTKGLKYPHVVENPERECQRFYNLYLYKITKLWK